MAICQAIDLMEAKERDWLSENTLKIHGLIRKLVPFSEKDSSQSEVMHEVYNFIKNNKFVV